MILLFVFLNTVLSLLYDYSRVCANSFSTPFSGYRLEYQISMYTWESAYHIVCCHDSKLIFDLSLNNTIPWTKEIEFSNIQKSDVDKLVMARKQSYMMKEIPLYIPNQTVGGLFINGNSPIPLISDNLLTNWVEMTFKLGLILHVPILSTPNIDDRRYSNRDETILIKEAYEFKTSTSAKIQKSIISLVDTVNEKYFPKFKNFNKFKIGKSGTGLTKFVMLSKIMTNNDFESVVQRYHDLTNFD